MDTIEPDRKRNVTSVSPREPSKRETIREMTESTQEIVSARRTRPSTAKRSLQTVVNKVNLLLKSVEIEPKHTPKITHAMR